jgi:hypothetical protein
MSAATATHRWRRAGVAIAALLLIVQTAAAAAAAAAPRRALQQQRQQQQQQQQQRQQQQTPGLPVYGNWCGPGYGAGRPTDALDACCKVHDDCYDSAGYFNCGCDQRLITCLNGANADTAKDPEEARSFRSAAVLYFRAAAAFCRGGGGGGSGWLTRVLG